MSHKIAKLLLEHADGFVKRSQAVAEAMKLGMPLHEIEEYLDWLDIVRAKKADHDEDNKPSD